MLHNYPERKAFSPGRQTSPRYRLNSRTARTMGGFSAWMASKTACTGVLESKSRAISRTTGGYCGRPPSGRGSGPTKGSAPPRSSTSTAVHNSYLLPLRVEATPWIVPSPPSLPSTRTPPWCAIWPCFFDSNTPVSRRFSTPSRPKNPPSCGLCGCLACYRGESLPAGRKSLAFRVVMQHTERTLTDAEADAAAMRCSPARSKILRNPPELKGKRAQGSAR